MLCKNDFYFGDHVVPRFMSATPLAISKLRELNYSNIAIAFPDEGALKRFGKFYTKENFEVVVCTKVREGDKRIISIKEGDIKGKHVVIVDDLVKTGGTLIECKDALFRNGATEVSAFVTHAVFPQESWKRFLPKEGANNFANFFVTDSCPAVSSLIANIAPFTVLSLVPSMLEVALHAAD